MFTINAFNKSVGKVEVKFDPPSRYWISDCASADLPVQPPDEVDKTWTIRKTATTLGIECNGVEVLNYQFSDSKDSLYCQTIWGDEVKMIKFSTNRDTASDSYREKPTGNYGVLYFNHRR